mgnify:FL=1
MPANLPAEARAKWIKVMEAKTPEEKIRALEEFLSAVPKHKGTENLVHWVRRRIAQLRREVEERRAKERARGGGLRIYVEKSGDIQLALIGPPMSGKSLFMRCLTNANIEPDYIPYSTTMPIPGMFIEDNVYFQVVKAPSLNLDGEGELNDIALAILRNADGALIMLDCSRDFERDFKMIVDLALNDGIYLIKPRGFVRIEKRVGMGIQVVGKVTNATYSDVVRLLNDYGIYGALIYIDGEATLSDIEDALIRNPIYKPSIAILNNAGKCADEPKLGIPTVKAELSRCEVDRRGLAELIIKYMGYVRVYTKEPWSDTHSKKPFVLKAGSTVGDLAQKIHSDLYKSFKYARVWRNGVVKRVGLNYTLQDGDIVEIHA